jgi:hypothetical protein
VANLRSISNKDLNQMTEGLVVAKRIQVAKMGIKWTLDNGV